MTYIRQSPWRRIIPGASTGHSARVTGHSPTSGLHSCWISDRMSDVLSISSENAAPCGRVPVTRGAYGRDFIHASRAAARLLRRVAHGIKTARVGLLFLQGLVPWLYPNFAVIPDFLFTFLHHHPLCSRPLLSSPSPCWPVSHYLPPPQWCISVSPPLRPRSRVTPRSIKPASARAASYPPTRMI